LAQPPHLARDSLERQYFVGAAQFDGFIGHAEDHAGGFILGNGGCARFFHFQ
jgi:hypothetical protein